MWSKEKAQKLLDAFRAKLDSIPTGTSGRPDRGGKQNAKSLYETVLQHGTAKYSRQRGGRGGGDKAGGYVLGELQEFAKLDSLDEIDYNELRGFKKVMTDIQAKGSELNPANIEFRGIVGYSKKGGKKQIKRDLVWGHFLTPAYHRYRVDKAKENNERYDMPPPNPKWTSLKNDGSARPPLWEALFGQGGLEDLVDSFIELAGEPIDIPRTPEVEVANVRRKRGNLAEVPAVRAMVEEILQDKSLYAKNTNSPVKSRLKEAFNTKTIAVTEEDMKMIGPLVFVKVDGQNVRLSEIPGYLERRSIGLNFTDKMLRELIREVLGDREKTYETPYHKEGKVKSRGLVLKALDARRETLRKALEDIGPHERVYYDNLQDIIDACYTYDMEEYVPALDLVTLEMGRALRVRVLPAPTMQRRNVDVGLQRQEETNMQILTILDVSKDERHDFTVDPKRGYFQRMENMYNITPQDFMREVREMVG
tara:strand:+ start:1350 stop:2783 length:1434 start_codon:yes stop_codon:yes gene_type:complete